MGQLSTPPKQMLTHLQWFDIITGLHQSRIQGEKALKLAFWGQTFKIPPKTRARCHEGLTASPLTPNFSMHLVNCNEQCVHRKEHAGKVAQHVRVSASHQQSLQQRLCFPSFFNRRRRSRAGCSCFLANQRSILYIMDKGVDLSVQARMLQQRIRIVGCMCCNHGKRSSRFFASCI